MTETTAPSLGNKPSNFAAILIMLAVCLAGYLVFELLSQGRETLRALDLLITYS